MPEAAVAGVERHRESGCNGIDYGVKAQGPRGVYADVYVACQ